MEGITPGGGGWYAEWMVFLHVEFAGMLSKCMLLLQVEVNGMLNGRYYSRLMWKVY